MHKPGLLVSDVFSFAIFLRSSDGLAFLIKTFVSLLPFNRFTCLFYKVNFNTCLMNYHNYIINGLVYTMSGRNIFFFGHILMLFIRSGELMAMMD